MVTQCRAKVSAGTLVLGTHTSVVLTLMGDQLALADASNVSILLEQSSGSAALSLAAVLMYRTKNIVILG